jgi:hypothetical protein
MNIQDLLLALDLDYQAGDWFGLTDVETRWGTKTDPRPCVLIDEHSGSGPAKIFPRTSTGLGQILHEAHQPNHAVRCQINKLGRIIAYQVSVPAALLKGNYRCSEPDPNVVSQILAARQP